MNDVAQGTKTVLITGASRGIGWLTARTLAASGHYVYAAMRNLNTSNAQAAEELTTWADSQGYALKAIEMDVTDESSVANAVSQIESETPIDILINNAGIMPVGISEAYTLEDIRRCMDVNFYGVVNTCRAVLPGMRKRRSGLLIHLSSAAGRLALPFFGVYCASKWALEAYAESLHYELAEFNIDSVLVEPSGHATDLVSTTPKASDTGCIASYGEAANKPGELIAMFQSMFDAGEDITDAANIAETLRQLIECPQPRPIRTTVGHDMGVERINLQTAPVQAEILRSFA